MAGKPKPIDVEQVRKLAKLGCTTAEIGDYFGVSHDTINRRFASEMSLGLAERKISLRRRQWKSVNDGSVPMMIHLGKQFLGQSDKTDITSDGKPVEATFYLPRNGRDAEEG